MRKRTRERESTEKRGEEKRREVRRQGGGRDKGANSFISYMTWCNWHVLSYSSFTTA